MRNDAKGRAWDAYFTTTNRLTERIGSALKASHKLSLPEYNVLLQVSRAGTQGIRLSILAHEVVFSPSRLTHTINRLVARGFVARSACEGDRRGGLVHLTETGRKTLRAAAKTQRSIVRTFVLDGMSEDELAVLHGIFERIASQLDAADAGTPVSHL
ncbi:MarR family transcriptional regulator [Schaalia sp. ZJ405]|uniref:MarR family winged helix-turn-helix transcriptional regulator n=1 Tax=Schaalia sp. ZJ405 TaxID=2709403 RepID=UPI0013EADF7B|nr:MarR family transcriptional regulator [Schaalia sp. ZJ405]QPK81506.1 MarR family transcriptional regulator [Schaalia sp. ZJ405]